MNIYNNGRVTLTVGDIERMQQRIAELEQKNAELVAQVEVLKSHMAEFAEIDGAFDAAAWESKSILLRQATPTQCLNQIKAEAGRAGYVQAIHDLGYKDSCLTDRANKYAERVKAGE